MEIEGRNVIGFDYSSGTGLIFQGVNPTLNSLIPEQFYIASQEDVDSALIKAKEAFIDFSKTSLEERALFLEAIAHEIEVLGDVLINKINEETGLSIERIKNERIRTIFQLHMFAEHVRSGNWLEATIDTELPNRKPTPKPDIRKMMFPLGPVVVFGASNFPLAYSVAGGDTASAFAAGCTVIVKAHPAHPGTSALVGHAICTAAKKSNMPNGVFSLLFDNGFVVGKALVEHSYTAAVGFTGSLGGGRALFDLAAKRTTPIPVFAEMGSTNPVVLLPEALKIRANDIAINYAASITLEVGQFCTNPGLLLAVGSKHLEQFKKHLIDVFKHVNPGIMLHKGIAEAFVQKSNSVLSGSEVNLLVESDNKSISGQGRPIIATVKGAEFIINPTLHQEVFGPFSLLVECESVDELYSCVKSLHGQLTGTLIGEPLDFEEHREIVDLLQQKVGRVIFNGVPTGVEVCPSMTHGGTYPATTDSRFTAVGVHSIKRFLRPVSFQNAPSNILPEALKDNNPLNLLRLINGKYSTLNIK